MSNTKFNPKARAEQIAAELKAAEAAQAAYDASIDEALEKAGRNRVEFVEVLYGHFGIEPETTVRKDKEGKPVLGKDGQPVTVKTDKDESVRISKLAEAFEKLVERAESNKKSDAPTPAVVKPSSSGGEQVGQKVA